MCRYDFFPELIHYGKKKANNFVLVSAAPKGFFDKNILERMYLKNVYKSFTKFIAVSNDLKQTINKITSSEDIRVYDFRINQIQKRIAQSSNKIIENYAYLPPLIDFMKSNENTIIYGSFWNHELNLFENKAFHQFNHIIVPHQLSPKYIEEIESFFKQKSIRVEVIDENESAENVTKLLSQNNETTRVFILNVKGILCELYQFTNYSSIGGGFGDSIHSVLEPFISESFVICGPKVKRSSEYDFINGSFPNRIKKVDSLEAILSSISFKVTPKEREEFAEYIDFQKTNFNEIITWTLT
jgi:3-deoxy-D-manno-octulosonic-acid transferase